MWERAWGDGGPIPADMPRGRALFELWRHLWRSHQLRRAERDVPNALSMPVVEVGAVEVGLAASLLLCGRGEICPGAGGESG